MTHVSADDVGLDVAQAASLSIRRRKRGNGFAYFEDGNRIRDEETLARIRSLAIPPAYRDVRISANARAHLQALGRDEAGRHQYRYHPEWEKVRETRKAARLGNLVAALPRVRVALRQDVSRRRPDRLKALATAVALIDAAHIRVGGEAYLRANGTRGAATLLKRHVTIAGGNVSLSFRGKGGAKISCVISNGSLARSLKRIVKLPGSRLLQYQGEDGAVRTIQAKDINEYLRHISGTSISAKDLRTLSASATAAGLLSQLAPAEKESARRKQIADVMLAVSADLTNTPTVARKSYVHDIVLDAFELGDLPRLLRKCRASRDRSRDERLLCILVEDALSRSAPRKSRSRAQSRPPT